ncbi:heavy metal translocating P-type ATPase, partial [Burkholderia sp. 4812]|nr:heavy metal translocating P-type ATPase [Burkholderia sp. 4812]
MTEPLASAALNTIVLTVEGMHCGGCTGRVQRALADVPGVVDASVDLDGGSATVNAHDTVDPARLIAAVGEAGYRAALREPADTGAHRAVEPPAPSPTRPAAAAPSPIELDIDGLTCASCAGRAEKALTKVAGVTPPSVNLATER